MKLTDCESPEVGNEDHVPHNSGVICRTTVRMYIEAFRRGVPAKSRVGLQMDKELNLKGLRVTLYLPEDDVNVDDFHSHSVAVVVDDSGHEQSELLSVQETAQLIRFLINAMDVLIRKQR